MNLLEIIQEYLRLAKSNKAKADAWVDELVGEDQEHIGFTVKVWIKSKDQSVDNSKTELSFGAPND